ncbi:hypothetical protein ACFYY8_33800 [Streptosporangium sp. NPDC001559]|uniref:hypothetical protein n=1 Tax=Streptosporangium sp. NPDC001559 TaxID=3366187 RepID=UPI0036E6BB97
MSAPTYLDQLRAAVRKRGGDWTTRRAVDALHATITSGRARVLLNRLADEGLLIKHGKIGRLWTEPAPADLPAFVQAAAQRIRTIPGITAVEPGDGVIGVRHADGQVFIVTVRAEPPVQLDAYDLDQIRRERLDDLPEGDAR